MIININYTFTYDVSKLLNILTVLNFVSGTVLLKLYARQAWWWMGMLYFHYLSRHF